jgi:hypothetical protein
VVEFLRDSKEEILEIAENGSSNAGKEFGHHFPIVLEKTPISLDTAKSRLGLLSNIPGDAKAVAVIEDTTVDVNDLPGFIEDFNVILKERNLNCVHYAMLQQVNCICVYY